MKPEKAAKLKKQLLEIQKEKVKLQLQMKQYMDDNKIEFFDKPPNPGPNPPQAALLEAWKDPAYRTAVFHGGNRSGKTTIGTIITLSTLFGKWLWSGEKIPFPHKNPRKIRAISGDWEKQIKTVLIPELHKWWPKSRPVTIKKNSIGVDTYWTDDKTGSILEIVSNNQEVSLLEGWSGDLIFVDEPCDRDIYIANARGLVDRLGRSLFCMTILKEPWIHHEIVKKLTPDGKPDPSVFSVHAQIYDNVGYGITQQGIDQFAALLNDEEKEARLMGIPSYMSGLVYPQFSRKYREKGGHLVKRFQVPLDWPVDIAIDVHPRKQQAILFMATSPKQEKYLVQEIWSHGDAKFIAEAIIRAAKHHCYRVNRIIIDPFAKGDSNNNESVYDIIERMLIANDMLLETATKDKEQGVLEVKNYLKGPNNMPSLFVFDDLVHTIKEFEGLMWDADSQKIAKENDDMMENLYRLILLNTKYVDYGIDPDEEDDRHAHSERSYGTRDRYTGY